MARSVASGFDREEICAQLRNLLALWEHSGVEEIMLPGGGDALLEAARALFAERATPEGGGGSGSGLSASGEAGSRGEAWGAPARPLSGLEAQVAACKLCELHRGRTNAVFGEGNPRARLMFIGEGPGADEDVQGRPFVGRAGALLTKIIEAMGLARGEVYIGNVVKCRPPGNRVPEPDEIASCLPYLEKQIEAISPEIICTLGNVATQTVTGERRPISEMRGRTFAYRTVKVVPTYHPAACLRNPDCKKLVWEDIKVVMRYLKLPIKAITRSGASPNRN